jgi:tRNA pseudouridine55 synthase
LIGVLNVNKPKGMTSHDVVECVRRILRERRIGHTGTLDPLATGVLVLCVGQATRIARYLEAGEKEYKAVMRLGVTTDTLDAGGLILETRPYSPPGEQVIRKAMERFTGSIMQQPPSYSAIKVAGVPSYKLAREGRAEPLKARPVQIFSIDLVSYEDPFVGFSVRCSKGVYIRSLCADIGSVLGTGAHLARLERTRSGGFGIEHAVTLEWIAEKAESGGLDEVVTPIDKALDDFPSVPISEAEAVRISRGNQIPCPESVANGTNGLVRLHRPSGGLVALARIVAGALKPDLVFSCPT